MALTGTFLADFSSFTQACAAAEVSLKSFESNAGKVETQLNRVSDSLSGVKIVQQATLAVEAVERIGGASKLTADEQARVNALATEAIAKFTVLGQQAPASMIALAKATEQVEPPLTLAQKAAQALQSTFGQMLAAFSASNIIANAAGTLKEWVGEAIQGSSVIVELADKTGDSIEQIQRWSFAGVDAGVSADAFASAAFKLGVKLDGGSGSVRSAVDALGLSYDELKTKKPDEQFNTIVKAMEGLTDVQQRNAIGVELMGKGYANIASAIKGFSDRMDEATVATDEQVKAVKEAEKAWEEFEKNTTTGVRAGLGETVIAIKEVQTLGFTDTLRAWAFATASAGGAAVNLIPLLGSLSSASKDDADATEKQTDETIWYTDELANAQRAVASMSADELAAVEAAVKLGKSHEDIANTLGVTDAELRIINESTKAHADELKQAADAAKVYDDAVGRIEIRLSAATFGLNAFSGTLVESVKYYKELGATTTDIATVLQQQPALIDAISAALNKENDAVKGNIAAETAWQGVLNAVELDQKNFGSVLDTVDGSIVDWAQHLLQSGVAASTVAQYYGLTDQQVRALQEDIAAETETINENTDAWDANGVAVEQDAVQTESAAHRIRDAGNQVKITASNFADALKAYMPGFGGGPGTGGAGGSASGIVYYNPGIPGIGGAEALARLGYSFAEIIKLLTTPSPNGVLPPPVGPRIPGYAGGVTDAPGGWATVGEHGPETMYVPKGASIFANGSGPGVTVYNTFHIVDTESNIAKRVSASITRSIMAGRQLV